MPITYGTPEYRINTAITADYQGAPVVADLPGIGYVIIWESLGVDANDSLSTGLVGQCYRYDGQPVGNQFLLSNAAGSERAPAVVALGNGTGMFQVSWEAGDGASVGIHTRSFFFGGNAASQDLVVNTTTAGQQTDPDIVRLNDGGYLITWTSISQDLQSRAIYARRYDAYNQPVSGEIQVNANLADSINGPHAVALLSGGYAVAFTKYVGGNANVYLQQFDHLNNKVGGETLVNTSIGNYSDATVAQLAYGDILVVWSNLVSGVGGEVYGQRFDGTGAKVGTEFLISGNSDGFAYRPDVIALPDGGFAVTFESNSQILLRRYDYYGVAQGSEWPIDDNAGSQALPSIALLGDGSFVVAYQASVETIYNQDVFAQRFRIGDVLTEGADKAMGTQNSDYIEGFGGNDELRGDAGDDLLAGGEGADRLIGGGGTDEATYAGAAAAVSLNLLTGSHSGEAAGDTFDGIEQFSLTRFADRFIGGDAADAVYGLAGDDILIGGLGIDRLDGGDGNDVLEGGGHADILIGGAGEDEVTYIHDPQGLAIDLTGGYNAGSASGDAFFSIERFTLTRFDDWFVGAAGADRVSGGIGNDDLRGLDGNDTLDGGLGNDLLDGGAGADTMTGGAGNDTFHVDNAADVVIDGVGEGTDRVATSVSYALAIGSAIETLEVVTLGSVEAINLTGSNYANTILGNNGVNLLDGGNGNDVLMGLGGNDALIGGFGGDAMYGGAGNDAYYVDAYGDTVVEAAGEGNDRIAAMGSFTLVAGSEVEQIEAITLSATNAMDLAGNEFAQTIVGNAGVNILRGEGGNDTLVALAGDDYLVGGAGNDTMYGGLGNDTYYVDAALDTVKEGIGEGSDRIATGVSYALAGGAEIETLEAVNQSATDALNLTGNEFANTLIGNNGANLLDGKGGNDVLVGLGGADIFAFTSALGAGNVDSIAGFSTADDTIALDDAAFAGLGLGALAAGAFVTGAAAADADDRIIYNAATGQLLFDADGSGAGAAIHFATLAPALGLTASDFQVI